ncbi:hypothetical protein OH76DRAFT_1488873 [Lentinus brumalis]|uniref:Uncharacterized protein n=1 Tax=Lentinus brumalis TaxID=2498619 RepID=A0A371CPC8_9APHY|nr:hypothetical protein OH76DRAFT_1488873 [Polyporus brumalis]
MASPADSHIVAYHVALASVNPNVYRPTHHSLPLERTLTTVEHDLPQPQETAQAVTFHAHKEPTPVRTYLGLRNSVFTLSASRSGPRNSVTPSGLPPDFVQARTVLTQANQWFASAALNLHNLIASVDRGDVRVELLEDWYTFVLGPALRTYVLRLTGVVSGTVSQFVLPASPAVLYAIPVIRFISWVHAFERGGFRLSDNITPAQRELLIDFARIWEGFARQAQIDRGWYYFIALLHSLVAEPLVPGSENEDGSFGQLAVLSRWAREYYPNWFPSEAEDYKDDPEMPELVEVYGSDSDEQ